MLDDTPDYTKYTLADLYDVEKRIDREKFPTRHQKVHQEIALREQRGELDEMPKPPPKFWSISEATYNSPHRLSNTCGTICIVCMFSIAPFIYFAGGDSLFIKDGKYYASYKGRKHEISAQDYAIYKPLNELLFTSLYGSLIGFMALSFFLEKVERDRKLAQTPKKQTLRTKTFGTNKRRKRRAFRKNKFRR